MDSQHIGRIGARHLSQIQEESDSREHSSCFLPPIIQQQQKGERRKARVVERQEERSPSDDPSSLPLGSQQEKLEDNRSLLEELAHIEKELRESQQLDEERQREAEFLRQQQNKLLWQNLCYLSLSQRITKPWVSSYFKTFPMHIYCLPVQGPSRKGRRWGLKKRR
ncbi:uncharacterized protein LOC143413332 [Maylandia zebra]|uniref:uncharacterized protein LOC143413332 n=1 Tax=Maylandia zebra TaxID=106582 RepID=UPI00403CB319